LISVGTDHKLTAAYSGFDGFNIHSLSSQSLVVPSKNSGLALKYVGTN
jgi:hypothetical protein